MDLDGTLASYDGWHGGAVIGNPVPLMAERVRAWIGEGKDVRIFTARVGVRDIVNDEGQSASEAFADAQRELIQDWTEYHFGARLPVTAQKDFQMVELWDDRAVAVEHNTGEILGGLMEIKKQPIGNGFCFEIGLGEFMAYRNQWWAIRAIHDGFELICPTTEQQVWLDTFTEIIPNS